MRKDIRQLLAEEELRHVDSVYVVANIESSKHADVEADQVKARVFEALVKVKARHHLSVEVLDAASPDWAVQRQAFFDRLIKQVNE